MCVCVWYFFVIPDTNFADPLSPISTVTPKPIFLLINYGRSTRSSTSGTCCVGAGWAVCIWTYTQTRTHTRRTPTMVTIRRRSVPKCTRGAEGEDSVHTTIRSRFRRLPLLNWPHSTAAAAVVDFRTSVGSSSSFSAAVWRQRYWHFRSKNCPSAVSTGHCSLRWRLAMLLRKRLRRRRRWQQYNELSTQQM